MTTFSYLLYILFNSHKAILRSNIVGLEEIRLTPIYIGSGVFQDISDSNFTNEDKNNISTPPVFFILDYDDPVNLLPIIMHKIKHYQTKIFIILAGNSSQNIYQDRFFYKSTKLKIDIFFLENPYKKIFLENFNEEVEQIFRITFYTKKNNFTKILLYSVLSIVMLLLFFIFRIWLSINAEKDPVCTITEIAMCPTLLYENIKEKKMESCLICMEPFDRQDLVRFLTCEHYYHAVCVDGWLESMSARCPYCRKFMKIDV